MDPLFADDVLQQNMIEAWQDRAARVANIVQLALLAPALTEPLYVNALQLHYQTCHYWAGYWINLGGR